MKKLLLVLVAVAVAAILGGAGPGVSAGPNPDTMTAVGPSAPVAAGQDFDVDMDISTDEESFSGYRYYLSYNPAIVQADSVVHLLGGDICIPHLYGGHVVDSCFSYAPWGPVTGTVGTVQMHCVGAGTSTLDLVSVLEEDMDGSTLMGSGGLFIDTTLYDGEVTCLGGPPVCGDGHLDPGEECDDGNTQNGDGCSSTCQIEGDTIRAVGPGAPVAILQNFDADIDVTTNQSTFIGYQYHLSYDPGIVRVDSVEQLMPAGMDACLQSIDNGVGSVIDTCQGMAFPPVGPFIGTVEIVHMHCVAPGTSTLDLLSLADDPEDGSTLFSLYAISVTLYDGEVTCVAPPVCGDGQQGPGEQCDDGNTQDGDGCSSTCQIEGGPFVCGDGHLDPGEQCDDGNTQDGDGCSSQCQIEGAPPVGGVVELHLSGSDSAASLAEGSGSSSPPYAAIAGAAAAAALAVTVGGWYARRRLS